MTLVSNLQDFQLELDIGRVAVPLSALSGDDGDAPDDASSGDAGGAERVVDAERGSTSRSPGAPDIRAPTLGEALKMKKMRTIRVPEWISRIKSGVVTVRLPLPERVIKKSVLEIDLTAGHTLVIELVARDSEILYSTCNGTIEPPVELPLGIELSGIEVNEDGEVIAILDGFPDLNLTRWVSAVPKIPGTVNGLVYDLLGWEGPESEDDDDEEDDDEDDGDAEASSSDSDSEGDDEGFDFSKIRVSARDIIPVEATPLDLGAAGVVTLIKGSVLRLDYRKGRLAVRGRVVVRDAQLIGNGFRLKDIRGTASIEYLGGAETRIALDELDIEAASLSIQLDGGTSFQLGPLDLRDTSIDFNRDEDGDVTFSADTPRLQATLQSGLVVLGIDGEERRIAVDPTDVFGALRVESGEAELDIQFGGLGLDVDAMPLALGPLALHLAAVRADGSGRMRGSTRDGFTFEGDYTLAAQVSHSSLTLDALRAHLDEGSHAVIAVTRLVTGPEGLRALEARGGVQLELHSGSVPLMGEARLHFEDGGSGSLQVERLTYDHTQPWPDLDAYLTINASSAPTAITDLITLPAGRAHLEARCALEHDGLFALHEVTLGLSTIAPAAGDKETVP